MITAGVQRTGPAPAPLPERGRSGRTERDPYLDNAKLLLVTLVVVGHLWELTRESALGSGLYDFLYLFHVPAFVMVTGYLSRSFDYSRRSLTRLLTTVLVPYLVFEGALAGFRVWVGGEDLEGLFADPHWPMWYLAALFLWRLATPVLTRVPHPLGVAVVVCLLGGLTSGDVLDTARAMGLLPFFVMGLLARPEHLGRLRQPANRLAGAIALAAAALLAPFIDGRLSTEWLYWRSSYAELGVTFAEGVGIRLGMLAVCALLALAALSLVPASRQWFTPLGAATLVVYLVHGFPVKAAEYAGLAGLADAHPLPTVLVATVAGMLLATVLALPPVARRLTLVVDPVGSLRRLRTASRQAPATG